MSSQSFSQLITVNLQYNGIKITKQCSDVNCVKSIRIRGWSGPHLAIFWVNTGTCSVNLHMQFPEDLVAFAKEILSRELHFLCSVKSWRLDACPCRPYKNYIARKRFIWSNIFESYNKQSFSFISFDILFSSINFCIVFT